MSKMHHDDTSDLKLVAEVLKRVYGVRTSVVPTLSNDISASWACHLQLDDCICSSVTTCICLVADPQHNCRNSQDCTCRL
jgi:hypothetical protein